MPREKLNNKEIYNCRKKMTIIRTLLFKPCITVLKAKGKTVPLLATKEIGGKKGHGSIYY